MNLATATAALQHEIEAAGGVEKIRSRRELGHAFIASVYDNVIVRADGRARASLRRMIFEAAVDGAGDLLEMLRQKPRTSVAGMRARVRPARPRCIACGASHVLLREADDGAVCVSATRCARRVRHLMGGNQ